MALASAERAAGHLSKWTCCTNRDMLRLPFSGSSVREAYVFHTSRPWSTPGTQDAGRALLLSSPWAITSRRKQKARTNNLGISRKSLARALMALALFDIHERFFAAPLAVDLNVLPFCFRVDPQDLAPAALWADEPAVFHWQQFIMFFRDNQELNLLFYTGVRSNAYISSILDDHYYIFVLKFRGDICGILIFPKWVFETSGL